MYEYEYYNIQRIFLFMSSTGFNLINHAVGQCIIFLDIAVSVINIDTVIFGISGDFAIYRNHTYDIIHVSCNTICLQTKIETTMQSYVNIWYLQV